MATLSEIQSQIQKLQAQAEEIANKQSSAVLAEIRGLMDKHGVTIADIESSLRKSGRGRKAASSKAGASHAGGAKYRDPRTGATWTGHGRAPAWIANAKNRNRFLVDGETATTPIAVGKQPKAGNYVRGPQAPKYRDPETGATWSGRGKAPAWLAGAKDRTTYLIDAVAGEVAASEATPAKKRPPKKVATKKVGAKKAAKKVASKRVVAKKAAAEKTRSEATIAKKAAVKKSEAAGKDAPAKKAPAKKAAAKKAPASAEVPMLAAEQGRTETGTTPTT
jgi:DNA-binding protein H-NS